MFVFYLATDTHIYDYRDATFQEISWNQEISDRKKKIQEKWNSLDKNKWLKREEKVLKNENVSKFLY